MAETTPSQKSTLIPYFLLAFAFSWLIWLPGVLSSAGLFILPFPPILLAGAGAFGPFFSAFVLTGRAEGRPGMKALFKRGFDLHLSPLWWAVTLLLPPLFGGLSVGIHTLANGYRTEMPLLAEPWMILPTFLFMFFLGGPFQEEFGWRGYALPRLLEKWSPMAASLVLGLVWGLWHLPLFFIHGVSQEYMSFPVFVCLAVAFSFQFTWIYLRSGRNLFSALLLHASINTAFSIFPPAEMRPGGDQTNLVYLLVLYALFAAALVLQERTFLKNPGGEGAS